MRHRRLECVISAARWLMLGGMILTVANGWLGGFGGLTGWMAVWLGTCGACFSRRREEPGLWMLSVLFLVFSLLGFATFAWGLATGIAQARVLSPRTAIPWGPPPSSPCKSSS